MSVCNGILLLALAIAAGLSAGYTTGGKPIVAAAVVVEKCTPEVKVTSLERVEIGSLSETFLVKWTTNSSCTTSFNVRIEATRKDNAFRAEEKKAEANERSALVKVHGSRSDNLSKSVRAFITATGVLAGRGQTTVQAGGPFGNGVGSNPTFTVAGRVVDAQGAPIAGVKLRFGFIVPNGFGPSGQSTQSDANGKWQIPNVTTGNSVVITPEKPNFTFNPASISKAVADANVVFTGTPPPATFAVSGRVTGVNKAGIADVTISFNFSNLKAGQKAVAPGPVKTDANGNWSQSGFTGGVQYQARASKPNFTFNPAALIIAGAVSDLRFTGNQ
jgi:hypothetical protein